MKAEPSAGIIAIPILDVATYGMAEIGRMNADLIFPACLQAIFNQ